MWFCPPGANSRSECYLIYAGINKKKAYEVAKSVRVAGILPAPAGF